MCNIFGHSVEIAYAVTWNMRPRWKKKQDLSDLRRKNVQNAGNVINQIVPFVRNRSTLDPIEATVTNRAVWTVG